MKTDVATRWNSSLEMIETFLEQRAAIYASLCEIKQTEVITFTKNRIVSSHSILNSINIVLQLSLALTETIFIICEVSGILYTFLCVNFQPKELLQICSNQAIIDALDQLARLPGSFKEVTVLVISKNSVTISMVHPLKTKVVNHLKDFSSSNFTVRSVKSVIIDDLSKR